MNQTAAWDAGWHEQSASKNAANRRQRCPGTEGLQAPLRSSGGRERARLRAQSGARAPPAAARHAKLWYYRQGCQDVPRSPAGLKEARLPCWWQLQHAWDGRATLLLVPVKKCRAHTEKQFLGEQGSAAALLSSLG